MAILASSFVALLDLELQEDYRAMAAGLHVTPDELILTVIAKYAKDWRWSNRERNVPIVTFPALLTPSQAIATLADEAVNAAVTQLPATARRRSGTFCPTNTTTADLAILAVTEIGQARIGDVVAFAETRGVTLIYNTAGHLLTWLAAQKRLTRVSHGVYAMAADAAVED